LRPIHQQLLSGQALLAAEIVAEPVRGRFERSEAAPLPGKTRTAHLNYHGWPDRYGFLPASQAVFKIPR
jgi:hypothetical protein